MTAGQQTRLGPPDSNVSRAARRVGEPVFVATLLLILLTSAAFRVYKAHHTGIVYDEAGTYRDFSQSVTDALTKYDSANNHVINSIAIHYTGKLFGSYEHFVRIPALCAAVLFLVATAYIIVNTMESRSLGLALLALISLNYFVFDLSFLARGFAIALGVIHVALAVMIFFINRRIEYRWWFVPVMFMVLTNFLTFGSMFASVFVLAGINVMFVCSSGKLFTDAPNRRAPTLLALFLVPLISGGLLWLLLRRLIDKILLASQHYEKAPTLLYFRQTLFDPVLGRAAGAGGAGSWPARLLMFAVVAIVAGAGIVLVRRWMGQRGRSGQLWQSVFNSTGFVVGVSCVTILAMLVHSELLRKPLGNVRHGVFLIPLVLISVGILVDRAVKYLNPGWAKRALLTAAIAATVGLTAYNIPSAHAVEVYDWERQSMAGPLLRKLKAIDSEWVWNIALARKVRFNWQGFEYYENFGYRSRTRGAKPFDIAIWHVSEDPGRGLYLDGDYFDKFDCIVQIDRARTTPDMFRDGRLVQK